MCGIAVGSLAGWGLSSARVIQRRQWRWRDISRVFRSVFTSVRSKGLLSMERSNAEVSQRRRQRDRRMRKHRQLRRDTKEREQHIGEHVVDEADPLLFQRV